VVTAVASLAAWGQDQRPLPRQAPEPLVAPALRVSVEADEDLDPDRLRELARPGVVLYLRTRSNTLRDSTLENLARFDTAWVELRAPVRPFDLTALARLPGVGGWMALDALAGSPPLRRLAVRVEGPLDEARLARLQRARPALVQWRPAEEPDLLQWALFRQVPGRRVLLADPAMLLAVRCAERSRTEPAPELHVAQLLALSSDVFPCGLGTRVLLPPGSDRWLVQSILVRDPSAELVLQVGADAAAALQARALLEALGTGESR
jgi:hypothetical protein